MSSNCQVVNFFIPRPCIPWCIAAGHIFFSDYASIDDFDMGGDLISDYTAALMSPTTRQTQHRGPGHQEDAEVSSCLLICLLKRKLVNYTR